MNLTVADLPRVQGKLSFKQALAPYTWFRVGGTADVLFLPADTEDLRYFLQNLDTNIPVTVLGACSNVIIRDGGIEGVVVRLVGKFWGDIGRKGELGITARAGALDARIANFGASQGITGLEFFSGIPGTIGAAVHTNAGCYGHEFKDVVTELRAIDRRGKIVRFAPKSGSDRDCGVELKYRSSDFPRDMIVIEIDMQGSGRRYPPTISERLAALREKRELSQPIREKTGGSTFANPETGRSAWELIDQAGCRGMEFGGARVSEKHCNFITNTGGATARDIEELGTLVQRKVLERSGVSLRWEIRRIGRDSDELLVDRTK